MRALDSNVLLRFITQDGSEQTPLATRFFEEELTPEEPGYVSVPVLCETAWTLQRTYRFSALEVAAAVRRIVDALELRVAEEAAWRVALDSPIDLIDALVHELGRRAGCSETVTFDRRFARLPGVRLLGT